MKYFIMGNYLTLANLKILTKFLFCFILLYSVATQSTIAASFDCRKAITTVEKLICDSAEIRILDLRLYEAYKQAQRLKSDTKNFRNQQRKWLMTRDSCNSLECMADIYEKRVDELNKIAHRACSYEGPSSHVMAKCSDESRKKTLLSIYELTSLLSSRLSKKHLQKFYSVQDEWRKNVICNCREIVGGGTGPGHAARLVSCEEKETLRRLDDIRNILAGVQKPGYVQMTRSCDEIHKSYLDGLEN